MITSLASRVSRSTELRTARIEIYRMAARFIREVSGQELHLVAHRRRSGETSQYAAKECEQREDHHIPAGASIFFLEVDVADPSEFEDVFEVRGVEIGGHRILRAESSTVPNAIAALLLRDTTGKRPHYYFGWT